MSGIAFSEVARLVLNDHRRRDLGSSLSVLPVVCVDQPLGGPTTALLEAAIRAEAGGPVVADAIADGVRGQLDGLAKAVESLQGPDDSAGLHLSLSGGDGKVKAEFSDAGSSSWSPGQRNLAGGILAAFDDRVRRSELALVSYDENALDGAAADALWQFYCLHLPEHELGRLRTVVLVCHTATLVPSRHCQKYNSARFLVTGDRVDRRRSWNVDKQDIRLRAEEASTPVVLFLAAGFSSSSQVKNRDLLMGNELRDIALKRLIGDFGGEPDAATRFRAYCENRGELLAGESTMSDSEFQQGLTLERVLQVELNETTDELGTTLAMFREEAEEASDTPGECLNVLAELLEGGSRLILVTVNFDELIERRCDGLVETFTVEEDFESAPDFIRDYIGGASTPAPLLKLHGTLSEPKSIVATVASIAKGLPTVKADALNCLRGSDSEPLLWFYVGASMRDRDIVRHISDPKFAERTREWWVAPGRDRSVEKFIRDVRGPVWRKMGMDLGPEAKCITTTADIFMGELKASLRQS